MHAPSTAGSGTNRLRALLAVGVGVVVLGGCSASGAGQAAVSREFRISQATVDEQVSAVLDGLGEPPGQPPAGLAPAVTQRLVQNALVLAKSEDLGIELTPAQLEKGTEDLATSTGGREALVQAALQAGIPEAALGETVRTQLLLTLIGEREAGTSDTTVAQQAAQQSLVVYSEALDVQVAPRYGTWDDTNLGITTGSSVVESAAPQ